MRIERSVYHLAYCMTVITHTASWKVGLYVQTCTGRPTCRRPTCTISIDTLRHRSSDVCDEFWLQLGAIISSFNA